MSYINDFIAIMNQDDDNTYKTTWARAILECIEDEKYEIQHDYFVIYHYDLVQKLMKYYWNLIGFFELSQGPTSVLDSRIEEIKDEFYHYTRKTYPVWYDKIETFLKRNPVRLERQIRKFITLVNRGVASKFRQTKPKKLQVYELDTTQKLIRFTEEQIHSLKSNSEMLNSLIDFKMSEVIERYNKAPNIIRKVLGSRQNKIRQPNLHKYRNILIEHVHLEGLRDFYTNEPVKLSEISLEHLIPFNFIYSCDIWNIVIVSKDTAKKYRGKTPSRKDIDKLNERNQVLYDILKNTRQKVRFDLENSLNSHLLDRYYIDFKR